MIVTSIELMCRVLIIERKEAIRWDPSLSSLVPPRNTQRQTAYGAVVEEKPPLTRQTDEEAGGVPRQAASPSPADKPARPSILRLLLMLLKSRRAMTPVLLTLIYA